jgi:hypothetical protein
MAVEASPSASDDLLKLAEARFADLTEAEKRLLRAAPVGELARGGENFKDGDPNNDPSQAENWDRERSVRAEIVRWLCVDREARIRVDPKGILLYAARIDGPLDLAFVTVPFPVNFWCCRVKDDANLMYVDIPALYLLGSRVQEIRADGATVKGSVFLRDRFHAEGEVRLIGAQIGGDLDCLGGTFKNPPKEKVDSSGKALHADRISVAGSVFLRDGFSAEGEVRLLGAQIGGNLDCLGGTFKNPLKEKVNSSGKALSADGIRVTGGVFLKNSFSAEGEVRLLGAQIGGNLDCLGGTFKNPPKEKVDSSGKALSADGIRVTGGVFLRIGFSAEGEVRLLGAQIGGDLDCSDGTFSELNIQTAIVKGNFFWQEIHNPQLAKVDLRNASVVSIMDDEASWPVQGNLFLDGFVYGRISAGPTKPAERMEWLNRQKHFKPQPYRQLAKVLKEAGDDKGAKRVLFEMESRRRKHEDQTFYGKSWSWMLRSTIGYGFYPVRALGLLVVLAAAGWLLFAMAYETRAIAPTQKEAYEFFHSRNYPPAYYDAFSASIYSAENTFPLVRLGQVEKWQPEPSAPQHACPAVNSPSDFACRVATPGVIRWFRWGQILLGWVFATFFVAGVTGIVRRD